MDVFILVDRSASMTGRWKETIAAVNTYVKTLAGSPTTKDSHVTVSVFDAPGHFPTLLSESKPRVRYETLRSDVRAKKFKPLDLMEAYPQGDTPLYDAIGILAQQVAAEMPDKASIVIVTDGDENVSKEVSREGAKVILDGFRAQGFDVVFLGADFDAVKQASSVGVMKGNALNMTKGNYDQGTRLMAMRSMNYAAGVDASALAFSDADRAAASA